MKKFVPFLLLPLRLLLFAFFQCILAFIFYSIQTENAWSTAQGWWIIPGLLTNVLTFFILFRHFRNKGVGYFENFKFIKSDWGKDVALIFGFLIIAGPLSILPGNLISQWLYGSADATLPLFFRAVPNWVVVTGFFWAITQGIVELPFYFAYLMPRIQNSTGNGWLAWALAALFLALQHISLPLIFDIRFMAWRFGMFFLFAFFIGLCIKWRPRLLPYLMVIHALMDISAVAMLLTVK